MILRLLLPSLVWLGVTACMAQVAPHRFPPPDVGRVIVTLPLVIGPPSEAMLSHFYPSPAGFPRRAGYAAARCTAKADGTLADCVLETETPADLGFGEALLRMARFTPVVPASRDGVPFDAPVVFEVAWPAAR